MAISDKMTAYITVYRAWPLQTARSAPMTDNLPLFLIGPNEEGIRGEGFPPLGHNYKSDSGGSKGLKSGIEA